MFEEVVLQSVSKDIMMGEGKSQEIEKNVALATDVVAEVEVHHPTFLILLLSFFVQL